MDESEKVTEYYRYTNTSLDSVLFLQGISYSKTAKSQKPIKNSIAMSFHSSCSSS